MHEDFTRWLKRAYAWGRENIRIILIGFIALLLSLTYFSYVKTIFICIILVLLASVSKLYHRLFKSYLGIDLVLFSCVVASYLFGTSWGLVTGVASLILADVAASRFSHTSIISLIAIIAVSFIAPALSGMPLAFAGIALTIVYEIIAVPLYSLMGSTLPKILTFLISHLLFNVFMFLNFSSYVLRL